MLFIQWMCVPSLLTQGLVRRRQFDGRFTQRQDAASDLNMEAVLVMKIALIHKKNAINDAHLKVKVFVCFFCVISLLLCLHSCFFIGRFSSFKVLCYVLKTVVANAFFTAEGLSRNDPRRWVMRGSCIRRLLAFHFCSIISHFVSCYMPWASLTEVFVGI